MITVTNPYINKSKVLGYDDGVVDTGDMYGNQPLEEPTMEIEITEILIEDITTDEACDIANSKEILVELNNADIWATDGENDWECLISEKQHISVYDSKIEYNGSDVSILIQTCFTVYAR